jgi:hypothetical protein
MISSAPKSIAVLDGTWVDQQWRALFAQGLPMANNQTDETMPSQIFNAEQQLRFSIEKLLEARWGQPWARGIRETMTDGLAREGWRCRHEIALCTLGEWLIRCFERDPPGISLAEALEERYGSFARRCQISSENWGAFSHNLWILTALVHDQCLVIEQHFREGRLLSAAYPVVGHVYKGKIRKNHIWKSLRGSLFMRRIGKERLFAGLQHHSQSLHGFLTALELLIPHRKELRSPAGLVLQAVACAVANHHEHSLSFRSDPLGYWLALMEGIFDIIEPGRTFTDDGHPITVEITGRALHVVLPSFQVLQKRLGSATGLKDRARSLRDRLEREGPFSTISFQFGSTDK